MGREARIDGAEEEFATKLAAWHANKSIENAAELAAAGLVLGRIEEAKPAAKQLLSSSRPTHSAKLLSNRLISGDVGMSKALKPLEEQRDDASRTIHYLRLRWTEYPRNAFLRVEAARAYLTCGQVAPARRPMEIALTLAPENRFVLRSAARLFVHLEEFEIAHDLLRRCERVRHDPWLLASEIAVSSLAGRTSKYVKQGRGLISSQKFSLFQTSELASALATIELDSGAHKRSRKLFRQSLLDPNDNSLAQGAWAGHREPGLNLNITRESLERPNSYEARVIQARVDGDWNSVVENCKGWLGDEPFSSRPAVFGSYAAIALVGDYALGEMFAKAGLVTNASDKFLSNNLTVALVNQGHLDKAESVYREIERPTEEEEEVVAYLATGGLIEFRKQNYDGGRALYNAAIQAANRRHNQRVALSALIHLVNEELAVDKERGQALLKKAEEKVEQAKNKELNRALELVRSRHRRRFLRLENLLGGRDADN